MHVDRERLRRHVAEIARVPRPAESPQLRDARNYATGHLDEAGWEIEPFEFKAVDLLLEEGASLSGVNLIARHPRDPARGRGRARLCVGAHLDSLPDSPGADDNASAVATLLEIARLLPGCWPEKARLELELVVFDLEECGILGGAAHARQYRESSVDLAGMVSLEMLGYCDHRPGSQSLPRTLKGMYPDTADFIAVIGNQNSEPLLAQFRNGMKKSAGLPVETLIVPANGEYLQASRLSDHSPFWDAGYPALMITDTSFLRNPHYHTPGDVPETLDIQFLHRVAEGCLHAVRDAVCGF